jgi:hypothetical protein
VAPISDSGVVDDGLYLDDINLSYEPYAYDYVLEARPKRPRWFRLPMAAPATRRSALTGGRRLGLPATGYELWVDGSLAMTTAPLPPAAWRSVATTPGTSKLTILRHFAGPTTWAVIAAQAPAPHPGSRRMALNSGSLVTFVWQTAAWAAQPKATFWLDGGLQPTFAVPPPARSCPASHLERFGKQPGGTSPASET